MAITDTASWAICRASGSLPRSLFISCNALAILFIAWAFFSSAPALFSMATAFFSSASALFSWALAIFFCCSPISAISDFKRTNPSLLRRISPFWEGLAKVSNKLFEAECKESLSGRASSCFSISAGSAPASRFSCIKIIFLIQVLE